MLTWIYGTKYHAPLHPLVAMMHNQAAPDAFATLIGCVMEPDSFEMEVIALAHILVRHKVQSYAKWRPVFNEHDAARRAAGAIGTPQVFRSGDDPWEVLVLMEWDELEKARKFAASDDLREAMEKAGVADQPTVYFLSAV